MSDRIVRSTENGARLAVLAAGLLALAVLAAPAVGRAEEVTVSGCPQPGVEAGCIALMAEDGMLYNITAAVPKPEPGVAGTVTGTVSEGRVVVHAGHHPVAGDLAAEARRRLSGPQTEIVQRQLADDGTLRADRGGRPPIPAGRCSTNPGVKLVVEPGGAAALAALLAGRVAARGRTLVAVLSGGNIDGPMLNEALARDHFVARRSGLRPASSGYTPIRRRQRERAQSRSPRPSLSGCA